MDALLVIDVQQALITGAYREQETLAAISTCIDAMRERGGRVVFIQHCHTNFEPMKKGKPGWQIHRALKPDENDIFIEKQASDSFYETDLEEKLQANGVDHLYICGLQSDFCVDATCRAALSRDYAVTLISDGHTTGDGEMPAAAIVAHHNYALSNLAHPKASIGLKKSSEL